VDPDSHTGWFGDSFTSTYTVQVDQTVVDSDFKVTGEIEIYNPTPYTVTFSVADAVNGSPATVVCPTYTLGPGASTTCTYSVDLDAAVDGTNIATITVAGGPVEGAMAQADYAFGDPTTVEGYETIDVLDYFDGGAGELLGSASDDTAFSYERDFVCSTDEGDYSDGEYTREFENYAEIDETGQQDYAEVDLTCYKPVVWKDAYTEWYREYTWEITKSVDPASHTGFAGDEFSSDYNVSVDQTISEYGYRAWGTINVTNPNPDAPMTVSVSDFVDGVEATLDCGGSLDVAPGATATCGYEADLPDATDRINTATVSFNGSDFLASAAVDFGDPIIVGYPIIHVTDYFDGSLEGDPLGEASGDFTFEYDRDFVCPTLESEYDEDGIYRRRFPNYAEIDETGQQDDAQVNITCYLPASARVIKVTTEGPEDIGAFPFEFTLYDPDGIPVETVVLDAAGEIAFDTVIRTEGEWAVLEFEWGWSTPSKTCTFWVEFPGSANQTFTCEFDNTENSRVELLKLTNGEPTITQVWSFELYLAAEGGFGSEPFAVSSTGSGNGVLTFEFGPGNDGLNPDEPYVLCELAVPAGYSSFWQVDPDGDGVYSTVIPYNPNAADDPPQDLGNRCIDVGADTAIPLTPGRTLHVMVDNVQPGGNPRTPGYWKNWNWCTGGGQAGNADSNGGWQEGFWLLEDVLDPTIGGGIVWDDILDDDLLFAIEDCETAVLILDKRRTDNGRKVARDPLHNLATHLLAAQLNFAAGACTTQEVLEAALAAEELLDKYDFNGAGHDNLPKKSDDVQYAHDLAGFIDEYNNGEFCGDFAE
jgi:hypothetical protein